MLLGTITTYVNQGFSKVVLLFSSSGGVVDVGITLYNTLRALPVKLLTYNIGVVDSAGNVVFLAGEERYASTNSRFMFHGVGYDMPAMRLELRNAAEALQNIKRDHARISSILEERTKLTSEEIERFFRETIFLAPEEAKESGIIQDIYNVQIPAGCPFVQIILQ